MIQDGHGLKTIYFAPAGRLCWETAIFLGIQKVQGLILVALGLG